MANETVTIPGLPLADKAYGDMIVPVARGTGDYGVTVEQLRNYINAPGWHGTQAQYNALASYDPERWYFIELDDEVVAIYRGEQLVTAKPNMVGEFTQDSTPDDWYWYPNGVKTPIPVDPSTCKFSYYWPGVLKNAAKLFIPPGVSINNWEAIDSRLKSWERMPTINGGVVGDLLYYMLSPLVLTDRIPVIDCQAIISLYYICIQNATPTQYERIAFVNTEKVIAWNMILSLHVNHKLKIVTGLDASSLVTCKNAPLSIFGAPVVEIVNLGKASAATTFDLRNKYWGDDTKARKARQSLVDSLLTNSFDRTSAGYAAATITLSSEAFARLTASEVSAITAKGFTLVTT